MELIFDEALNAPQPTGDRRAMGAAAVETSTAIPAFLCHVYDQASQALFAGRSDGMVASWKLGPFDSKGVILGAHKGAVRCMITDNMLMASGGMLLITGSADRSIKLWDPAVRDVKDACVQTLTGHGGTVNAVCSSHQILVSCSNDNTVRVWRSDPERSILLYPWMMVTQTIEDIPAWITSAVVRAGEAPLLYIGDSDGTLSVFTSKPATSTARQAPALVMIRQQPKLHRLGISSMLLITEQNLLCTLSYDSTLRVSEASTGSALLVVENPRRCRFTSLDWNSYKQELFLADELGFVNVWNINMDKCLKELQVAQLPVTSISVQSNSQKFLLTCGDTLQRWHVTRELQFAMYTGHTDAVVALITVPAPPGATKDDERVFSAGLDNCINCWDPYDMTCLYTLKETDSEISCMTILPHCGLLVTGNEDGSVRFWNPEASSSVAYARHANTVSCLTNARLRRSQYLLSGSFDGQVGVWDVTQRRSVKPTLEYMFQAHADAENPEILCICFFEGEDDKSCGFLTGGNDKIIRLWSLVNYQIVATLEGHTDSVSALAVDANFLFSASEDCSIRIWNMANQREPYCLSVLERAHDECVRSLLLLPADSLLVSCAYDGRIRVWDYHHYNEETGTLGKQVQQFNHKNNVRCLAFRASERHILAGTEQCNILLFPLGDTQGSGSGAAAVDESKTVDVADEKTDEDVAATWGTSPGGPESLLSDADVFAAVTTNITRT